MNFVITDVKDSLTNYSEANFLKETGTQMNNLFFKVEIILDLLSSYFLKRGF